MTPKKKAPAEEAPAEVTHEMAAISESVLAAEGRDDAAEGRQASAEGRRASADQVAALSTTVEALVDRASEVSGQVRHLRDRNRWLTVAFAVMLGLGLIFGVLLLRINEVASTNKKTLAATKGVLARVEDANRQLLDCNAPPSPTNKGECYLRNQQVIKDAIDNIAAKVDENTRALLEELAKTSAQSREVQRNTATAVNRVLDARQSPTTRPTATTAPRTTTTTTPATTARRPSTTTTTSLPPSLICVLLHIGC